MKGSLAVWQIARYDLCSTQLISTGGLLNYAPSGSTPWLTALGIWFISNLKCAGIDMRLILIRHAESKHSQNRLIAAGASCPGLTDHGFQQARQLAEHLEATGELQRFDLLLSSPVLRAYQTAHILAGTIGRPISLH